MIDKLPAPVGKVLLPVFQGHVSVTYMAMNGCPCGWGGEEGVHQIPMSSHFCSSAKDNTVELFFFQMKAKQLIDRIL